MSLPRKRRPKIDPAAVAARLAAESLRDRCREVIQKLSHDAILRQNDPIQTLMEFVLAECGRPAFHPELAHLKAMLLYFPDCDSRQEWIDFCRSTYPDMVTRKIS